MLVADHEQARTALEDLGQLDRVQHAFDGQIDDHAGGRERGHDRRQPGDDVRGARRAHRHRRGLRRRWQHEVERPCAEAQQRQLDKLHVDGARLGLGQDGDRLALGDLAQIEHPNEGVDPLALDALDKHAVLPQGGAAGCLPNPSIAHSNNPSINIFL